MIVHIRDKKRQLKWTPECSNCGAMAIDKKLDAPKITVNPLFNGTNSVPFTIDTIKVCPYGCIDEEAIV